VVANAATPPQATATSQLSVGVGVIAILALMLVAMPPFVLDVAITLNLALSLVILLVALYVQHPLEISAFPAILLLSTLFRLSLNVTSTRLILLNGERGTSAAGHVIESFGDFVVGGNYVVGSVVFLLFVIINFVVITKGSGRIAEVAARFTLDAMPGKQMAIDADLNAGIINDKEAVARRQKIQDEADFYGAMDGASKFVRGDAVAGVLITLVNIVGGLVIGTLQKGQTLVDAAATYTLLTVGDGLVAAIPALLVSVAAGLIVTRANDRGDFGALLGRQLGRSARPLAIAAGVLGGLALVPGLPHLAFGLLAAGLAGGALRLRALERARAAAPAKEVAAPALPERPVDLLRAPDPLELQVGFGLIELVDPNRKGELLDRIRTLRREFTLHMGFPVPLVHIRDNLRLASEEYAILVRGVRVGKGTVFADHELAIAPPGGGPAIPGIETRDPTFGLPALWVKGVAREQAQAANYTVVDPASVIMTHLTEVLRRHAPELVGRQQVQEMLDAVAAAQPKLVAEVVPDALSLGGVQKVLQNLLREGVPVRDMPSILEALADYAPKTKDTDLLTELVRERLAPQISAELAPQGKLPVLVLAPELEKTIADSIQRTDHGTFLSLDAGSIAKVVGAVRRGVERVAALHPDASLLASPEVRPHLRRMIERVLPRHSVVSANELSPDVQIESLGTATLN
jgi:flagellar biosynthesis protein FlhA